MRHALCTVVAAAVCAVVAGCRSYAAIGEWVADLPADTAQMLGIDPQRRPSEAMLRRLLQALNPDQLTAVIAAWLTIRSPATGVRRAIAVDGKSIRGSRTADSAARHVLAACDQATGAVVTADAPHCQRDHVAYLAQRGAHWILTVKGNQPHLHAQLASLPWRAVPDADRTSDRGPGTGSHRSWRGPLPPLAW